MTHFAISFWWFLTHVVPHPLTGPTSVRQGGYLFWSGIGGSFILGGGIWTGAIVAYRKHSCHAKWCFRIGRHPHGHYVLCSKHHPHVPRRGPLADDLMRQAGASYEPMGRTTDDDGGAW